MATTPAALQPMKRRSAPTVAPFNDSRANDGTFAISAFAMPNPQAPRVAHVYRLADMQHWTFQYEDAVETIDLIYVDKNVVYYGSPLGVYRQAIAALGPGDPPP